MRESRASSASGLASSIAAAASKRWRRASSAAMRTAGSDRRRGHRAPGVPRVGQRLGVADDRADVGELRAEALGGDLREHRSRAGSQVLRSREDVDGRVGVHADERVRRRAAAGRPDLGGDTAPTRLRSSVVGLRSSVVQPKARDALPVAFEQVVARVRADRCADRVAAKFFTRSAMGSSFNALARARSWRPRARTRPRRSRARGTPPCRWR